MTTIDGKSVAFLCTNGVEQIELDSPWQAALDAGGVTHLISLNDGAFQAFHHLDKADTKNAELAVGNAKAIDYDALVLPGGVANGDFIRADRDAVSFTRAFMEAGKPVAAICHGAWVLAEADVVRGRTMTSYPSLRTDLRNAGAMWVDREVVVDGNLVTSRNPHDLPAFNSAMIESIASAQLR